MSKFVKGKVLECTLNKGFTYIKVQREVGEGYFVVRAKGDTSFEIGKSETFKGVTLNEKLTNEERKVYDLDSGIKEGNTTWAPTEQSTQNGLDQSTKPKEVDPDAAVCDLPMDADTIGKMAAAAANILAFSPISNQVENMDEMGDLIEGMTLKMFSVVTNIQKKFNK